MQIETGTETVTAERTDGVGIITLNRPERRNALHSEMFDAVPRALERFVGDPEVGCVMITGAGTAFCSGGDVGSGASRRPDPPGADDGSVSRAKTVEDHGSMLAHDARMVELLHGSPKVTLAALPGAAVGAGMSIALAADLRIAAESAKLIPGWSRLAFSGDFGGTWFLTRLVGPAKALEILIDDRIIEADEALSLGLFNRVVPEDEFRAAAMAWAVSIARGPRVATRFIKANVQQAERLTLSQSLPMESERMARSALTDDHRQAVARWFKMAEAKRSGSRLQG
jgi:2-(1,2-epoxy-1,2-dihydrophenyl)acetyl-CoA isomerase